MTEIQAFSGFPKDGLRFFREVAANNNREWFQEHKQDYLDNLQAPALAFLVEFGEKLKVIVPGIRYDTRTNGAGSLMRIYRDIRFSKDKSPYKDHLGINFWEGAGKQGNPGFHFWMDASGAALYGGFHGFPRPFLAAYREAVAGEQLGSRLEKIMAELESKPGFAVGGEQLKRVPPGYSKDHPRGDLLRYKGLYARGPKLEPAELQSADLVDTCLEHARVLAPLHRWFVQVNQQTGS